MFAALVKTSAASRFNLLNEIKWTVHFIRNGRKSQSYARSMCFPNEETLQLDLDTPIWKKLIPPRSGFFVFFSRITFHDRRLPTLSALFYRCPPPPKCNFIEQIYSRCQSHLSSQQLQFSVTCVLFFVYCQRRLT